MKKYVFTILRTILLSFSLVGFAVVALWAAPAKPAPSGTSARFVNAGR